MPTELEARCETGEAPGRKVTRLLCPSPDALRRRSTSAPWAPRLRRPCRTRRRSRVSDRGAQKRASGDPLPVGGWSRGGSLTGEVVFIDIDHGGGGAGDVVRRRVAIDDREAPVRRSNRRRAIGPSPREHVAPLRRSRKAPPYASAKSVDTQAHGREPRRATFPNRSRRPCEPHGGAGPRGQAWRAKSWIAARATSVLDHAARSPTARSMGAGSNHPFRAKLPASVRRARRAWGETRRGRSRRGTPRGRGRSRGQRRRPELGSRGTRGC